MGKPGDHKLFDIANLTVEEFVEEARHELSLFLVNMKQLKEGAKRSYFEWFYTFGFWNEALEFRDEFPQYFEEFN
jgi:hypothetical protein